MSWTGHLHPEHGTPGRQRSELFGRAVDAIELPEKWDPTRHLARELPQDGGALARLHLDEVHALLLATVGQDPPARAP